MGLWVTNKNHIERLCYETPGVRERESECQRNEGNKKIAGAKERENIRRGER